MAFPGRVWSGHYPEEEFEETALMSRYALYAGVNGDNGRAPQVARRATRESEVWVRQLTFEDGIEAALTMWADGTVALTVKRMNTGKVLHEWHCGPDGQAIS